MRLTTSFLLSIMLLSFSCDSLNSIFKRKMDETRVEIEDGQPLSSETEIQDDGLTFSIQKQLTPFVAIENTSLVDVLNINIDFDHKEEQIIIYKQQSAQDLNLYLAVVDFNTVRDEYILVWQERTRATKQRFIDFEVLDITGDHHNELIIKGIDEQGQSTIDIFKSNPRDNYRTFRSIFSVSLPGKIEVKLVQRSDAYQSGNTDGESFKITTSSLNQDDADMHMIHSTYEWSPRATSYILTDESYTSRRELEKNQLRDFLTKNTDEFETFLEGWWVNNNVDSDEEHRLIYFDKTGGTVSLYHENFIEDEASRIQNFFWENSIHTYWDVLQIKVVNQNVLHHKPSFRVRVESLQKIRVTLKNSISQEDTFWSGSYTHLPQSAAHTLLKTNPLELLPDLSGKYDGDDGSSIVFNLPDFIHYSGEEALVGGYSIYQIDVPALELIYLNSDSTIKERKKFELEYTEASNPTEIRRSLKLYEGDFTIYGFKRKGSDPIYFEQIEQLDQEEE